MRQGKLLLITGSNSAVRECVATMNQAKNVVKLHMLVRSHKAHFELVRICDRVKPKIEDLGPEELAKAMRANLIGLIS